MRAPSLLFPPNTMQPAYFNIVSFVVCEVYKISGYIKSIESDYLVLQEEGLPKKEGQTIKAAKFCIHVYLDTETLAGLSEWDNITVVGEITDTGTETLESFPTTYDRLYIDMGNAYIA